MYKNVYKYDEMKRSEHMAVRTTVGWYLWTHQLVEVSGPDAADYLDYLLPNDIKGLEIGRERYTTMLGEDGYILDDVVVFRLDEDKFWISTLFAHRFMPWYKLYRGNWQVEIADITKRYHMYAIQGPKADDMLHCLVKYPINDLKFFSFRENLVDSIPVIVNRAGFTGEKIGYELYIPAEKADEIEKKLAAAAEKLNGKEVTEFQVLAWTLPTEAGFFYMRDLAFTNPLEVGLEKGINWDKDFVGKEALLKIKEAGPSREMVGFTVADEDFYIRSDHLGGPGEPVMFHGENVGKVAKLVYGYVKDTNIGYILADKGVLKKGDKVYLHGHEAIITEKSFL